MSDLLLDLLLEADETPEQRRAKRHKARRRRCGAEMDKPEGGRFIYQCEIIAECEFCAGRLGEAWQKRMLQAIERGEVWRSVLTESQAHKLTSENDKAEYLRIPQVNGMYVVYHGIPVYGGELQSDYTLSLVDWTGLAISKAQSGKRVSGHLGKLPSEPDSRTAFRSIAVGIPKDYATPETRRIIDTLKEIYALKFKYVETVLDAEGLAEAFRCEYTSQMQGAGVPDESIIVIRVTSRITLFVSQESTNGLTYQIDDALDSQFLTTLQRT